MQWSGSTGVEAGTAELGLSPPRWIPRVLGGVPEVCLVLLILFTPFAFGTVETWSIAIAELLVLAMAVAWLLCMVVRGEVRVWLGLPGALALALLAWVALQIVPLPASLVRWLSPAAAAHHAVARRVAGIAADPQTLSLQPYLTRLELLKLATYALLFLTIVHHFTSRRQVEWVLRALAIGGFLLALFGIVQHLTFNGKLYWAREFNLNASPFGPYVNRNHFAGYMAMAIPMTLGYAMALAAGRRSPRRPPARLRQRVAALDFRAGAGIFAASTMGAALLFSGSRGGFISFLLSGALFAALTWRRAKRVHAWWVVIVLDGALGCGLWLGGEELFGRLLTVLRGGGIFGGTGRLWVWADTWAMARHFLVTGVGFGAFSAVFPAHMTRTVNMFYAHTENDYLQLLAETGLIGLGLALALAAILLHRLLAGVLKASDPWAAGIALGAATGVVAVLIHSLGDFNLRIPANAMLFVVIASLGLRALATARPALLGRAETGGLGQT